jgi:hypothetical protein
MNQIRFLVDRLHVGLSDKKVLRELYDRLKSNPSNMTLEKRIYRKEAYLAALNYHHENQQLYRDVMNGNL